MQTPPITPSEIETRISGHLNELLELWWAEQGAEKKRDLQLIAEILPFPRDNALRVLDLCCGPGDVGRAMRRVYPKAQIDCIDRDPFLTAICTGVNRREAVPGRIITKDLEDDDWRGDLLSGYHVVATINALHWFTLERAGSLLREVRDLLRSGGIFVFAEPAVPEPPFSKGFDDWKSRQPSRYSRENWLRFWSRANAILGYDHIALLGSRERDRIDEMSVQGWIDLVRGAGFERPEILWRDADEVIIAAVKA
jgi:SAM-dependent methyltransferase